MATEGNVLKWDLYQIIRGDLDSEQVRFPFPRFVEMARGMEFFRIARLSRFWRGDDPKSALLERAVADLVCALYGQACSWMFMVRSRSGGSEIECWFGAGVTLAAQLAGAFPGWRRAEGPPVEIPALERFPHVLRLTGAPATHSQRQMPLPLDRIDKLCRGLLGSEWVYAIHATPVARLDMVRTLNDLADQIQLVYAHHLLRQSTVAEPNRLAKQKLDLLEAKYKRMEDGRALGSWNVRVWFCAPEEGILQRGRGLLHSAFSGDQPLPEPVRTCLCDPGVSSDPDPQVPWLPPLTWLNSSEVAILATPPRDSYPGYLVTDYVRFGVESTSTISVPEDSGAAHIAIGEITDHGRRTGNHFRIPLSDLTKHGLIVGVTGSGKTNTSFQLLEQLMDRGIPFLVIESAKSEYRHLLASEQFRSLRVFTVGDELLSPLRLNPFEVPDGIAVQTHIDYLKSLFSAAFVLYPPMPYVLEQSIQQVYQDRGWDLALSTNTRGERSLRRFPTVSDVAAKIETVVDRMGYDERITMDIKAGLIARLDQFRSGGGKGPMLNTRYSINPAVLFGSPCVIELKQIVDDDEKAFLIGLVLIRLYEYYESGQAGPPSGKLRHVTLIEEAHRLLRNVSMDQGSEVTANPKGRAIEVFSNILSEIRAFGEGILIAEQIPVKLVPDAIKNTNLKIVHRLVSDDDRKLVGGTMNLDEAQLRNLITLRSGEAVAYREGMQCPVALELPLSAAKARNTYVAAEQVRNSYWPSSDAMRLPLAGCRSCPAPAPGRSCAERLALRWGGLRLPFRRLYNALRLEPEAIPQAFEDFQAACGRPDVQGLCPSSYCAFVELAEAEIEWEGNFYRWRYEDVDHLAQLACQLVHGLAIGDGQAEGGYQPAWLAAQQEFAALCDRLYQVELRPFPGCESCSRPCHYRYDMDEMLRSSRGKAALQSLHESMEHDELIETCRWAAEEVFHDAPAVITGAAICFATQLCHELRLAAWEQRDYVTSVADTLQEI